MIPTQKSRTRDKIIEKEPTEKEPTEKEKQLAQEITKQKIKPLSPVDDVEKTHGLKPTSEFYKGNTGQKISSDGSDDDDSEDEGKSDEKEDTAK